MLKKYKSKSCVSVSVALPTGGNAHVSFSPVTGGGSYFYTDNEVLQKGLEKHPKFGKLFKLDVVAEVKPQVKAVPKVEQKAENDGIKRIEVSNNEDAKDYLADKFGISHTKMRTRAAIDTIAKSKGIEFIWN